MKSDYADILNDLADMQESSYVKALREERDDLHSRLLIAELINSGR